MLKFSILHALKIVLFMINFLNNKSEPVKHQLSTQPKLSLYKSFCSSATLDKCLEHWFQMSEDSNKAFPVTYTDLRNTCSAMEKMDNCASRFINVCTKKQFQEMYQEMLQGVKGVFRIICIPGKDQNEYLQYSECYQLVTVKECQNITNKFRKNAMAHNLNGNITDQKDFCCDYKLMIDCQEKGIKKLCPTGASILFQKYMPKMAKAVLNDHCAHYTEKEKCHTLINSSNILSLTKQQKNTNRKNNSKILDQTIDILSIHKQTKTQLNNTCKYLIKQQLMFNFAMFIVFILVLF